MSTVSQFFFPFNHVLSRYQTIAPDARTKERHQSEMNVAPPGAAKSPCAVKLRKGCLRVSPKASHSAIKRYVACYALRL